MNDKPKIKWGWNSENSKFFNFDNREKLNFITSKFDTCSTGFIFIKMKPFLPTLFFLDLIFISLKQYKMVY